MPIVLDEDGRIGRALHLRVTPQHVVIGRDGRIQYVGHLADARLDAALLAAREGATLSPSSPAPASDGNPTGTQYGVGDMLPEETVRTLDGQAFELRRPAAPQGTVLVFLSPWCETYLKTTRPAMAAACRAARIQVATLVRSGHSRWLGVASGLWATAEDLQQYRGKFKVDIPMTLDDTGRLFQEFAVNNTPTVIVTDPAGKIVRRIEPHGVMQHALQGL